MLPQPQTALRVIDNATLMQKERVDEEAARKQKDVVVSSLSSHIRRCWEAAKDHKQDVEQQMLKNLRQRKGEYESDKLSEIRKFGGSEIFMRLTDSKCRTCSAWIRDVLSLDRPWDIEPTPVASLPPNIEDAVRQQMLAQVNAQAQQALASGLIPDANTFEQVVGSSQQQAMDEAMEAVQDKANEAARRMADRVADQLLEGGWDRALDTALTDDLTTFGIAIIKAPVIRSRRTRSWTQGLDGRYVATVADKLVPVVERVSPLDLYPSEDAEEVDTAAFLIEKYRITRRQLRSFRDVEGYSADEIEAVLEEAADGGLKEWTEIDSDREDLEFKDFEAAETIDVLIFHGDVPGSLLVEWGMEESQVPDPTEEIAVEAWLVGSHVIRAVLNDDPLGRRPYKKAPLYPIPGSFWGMGLPEILADVQQMCNAAARALANNMAMSSGPQVAVELERMPPGEDGSRMWPWKVWGFDQGYGNANIPIQFFQPQSNAQELLYIYNEFAKVADEVSGIPAYIAGDSGVRGAGKTASGLSMLMGAATKNIKSIIANIDNGIIKPTVEAFFDHNLQWSNDLPEYLGDCRVSAKGVTSLQVRDQNAVRLQEFLTATNNPVDFQIMGTERRAELLRALAKSLSLQPDNIAPDAEEAREQAMRQQMMMAAAQPVDTGTPERARTLGPDGEPSQGVDYRLHNEEDED